MDISSVLLGNRRPFRTSFGFNPLSVGGVAPPGGNVLQQQGQPLDQGGYAPATAWSPQQGTQQLPWWLQALWANASAGTAPQFWSQNRDWSDIVSQIFSILYGRR